MLSSVKALNTTLLLLSAAYLMITAAALPAHAKGRASKAVDGLNKVRFREHFETGYGETSDAIAEQVKAGKSYEQAKAAVLESVFSRYIECKQRTENLLNEHFNVDPKLRKKYAWFLKNGKKQDGRIIIDDDLVARYMREKKIPVSKKSYLKFTEGHTELAALIDSEQCMVASQFLFRLWGKESAGSKNVCIDDANASRIDPRWEFEINVYNKNAKSKISDMPFWDRNKNKEIECDYVCRVKDRTLRTVEFAAAAFDCNAPDRWREHDAAVKLAEDAQRCGDLEVPYCGGGKVEHDLLSVIGNEGAKKSLYRQLLDNPDGDKNFSPSVTEQAYDFLLDTFLESYVENAVLMTVHNPGLDPKKHIQKLRDQLNSCGKTVPRGKEVCNKGHGDDRHCKAEEDKVTLRNNELEKKRAHQANVKLDRLLERLPTLDSAGDFAKQMASGESFLTGMGVASECLDRLSQRAAKLAYMIGVDGRPSYVGYKPPADFAEGVVHGAVDMAVSFVPPLAVGNTLFKRLGKYDPEVFEPRTVEGERVERVCNTDTKTWMELGGKWEVGKSRTIKLDGQSMTFSTDRDRYLLTCDLLRDEYAFLLGQMTEIYREYPALFEEVSADDSSGSTVPAYRKILKRYSKLGGRLDQRAQYYRKEKHLWAETDPKNATQANKVKRLCALNTSDRDNRELLIDPKTLEPVSSYDCQKEYGTSAIGNSPDYSDHPFYTPDGSEKTCMQSMYNPNGNSIHAKAASEVVGEASNELTDGLSEALEELICRPDKKFYRDRLFKNPILLERYFDCAHKPLAELYQKLGLETKDLPQPLAGDACLNRLAQGWIACDRIKELSDPKNPENTDPDTAARAAKFENFMTGFVEFGLSWLGAGMKPSFSAKNIVTNVAVGSGVAAGTHKALEFFNLVPPAEDYSQARREGEHTLLEMKAGLGDLESALGAKSSLREIADHESTMGPLTQTVLMGAIFGGAGGAFLNGQKAPTLSAFTDDEIRAMPKTWQNARKMDTEEVIHAVKLWREALAASPEHAGKVNIYANDAAKMLNRQIKRRFGIDIYLTERAFPLEDRIRMLHDPRLEGLTGKQRLVVLTRHDLADLPLEYRILIYKDVGLSGLPYAERVSRARDRYLSDLTGAKKSKSKVSKRKDAKTENKYHAIGSDANGAGLDVNIEPDLAQWNKNNEALGRSKFRLTPAEESELRVELKLGPADPIPPSDYAKAAQRFEQAIVEELTAARALLPRSQGVAGNVVTDPKVQQAHLRYARAVANYLTHKGTPALAENSGAGTGKIRILTSKEAKKYGFRPGETTITKVADRYMTKGIELNFDTRYHDLPDTAGAVWNSMSVTLPFTKLKGRFNPTAGHEYVHMEGFLDLIDDLEAKPANPKKPRRPQIMVRAKDLYKSKKHKKHEEVYRNGFPMDEINGYGYEAVATIQTASRYTDYYYLLKNDASPEKLAAVHKRMAEDFGESFEGRTREQTLNIIKAKATRMLKTARTKHDVALEFYGAAVPRLHRVAKAKIDPAKHVKVKTGSTLYDRVLTLDDGTEIEFNCAQVRPKCTAETQLTEEEIKFFFKAAAAYYRKRRQAVQGNGFKNEKITGGEKLIVLEKWWGGEQKQEPPGYVASRLDSKKAAEPRRQTRTARRQSRSEIARYKKDLPGNFEEYLAKDVALLRKEYKIYVPFGTPDTAKARFEKALAANLSKFNEESLKKAGIKFTSVEDFKEGFEWVARAAFAKLQDGESVIQYYAELKREAAAYMLATKGSDKKTLAMLEKGEIDPKAVMHVLLKRMNERGFDRFKRIPYGCCTIEEFEKIYLSAGNPFFIDPFFSDASHTMMVHAFQADYLSESQGMLFNKGLEQGQNATEAFIKGMALHGAGKNSVWEETFDAINAESGFSRPETFGELIDNFLNLDAFSKAYDKSRR